MPRAHFLAILTIAAAILPPPPQSAQAPRDQAAPAPAPSGTASLSGVVAVLAGGQATPVRRARVTLQSDSSQPAQTSDTDVDGRYRIDHLVQGTYRIAVDKAGFVPLGRLAPIAIRAGQAATANVTMIHAAAIEGRVTAPDGTPVTGFTVSAVRLGFGPYGKRSIAIRQAITDDRGHFRLHTLSAGEYYIEAGADPLRQVNAQPGAQPGPKPWRTFYPGTTRLNEAGVVVLAAGQESTNVDFTVATAPLVTVNGRVALSSGQPPLSYGVRLQRAGAPPGEVLCFLPPDRSFQCPNVGPGNYWALVSARASATAAPEFAAMPIDVSGQPINNLTVTTAPGTPLAGRVEVEGGAPLPRDLQIAALETDYELPSAAPGGPPAAGPPPGLVGPDGTFSFPAVFGPRLIRPARLPDGWAVKSVFLDDAEITDMPTTFAAADKPRAVRVVLTPATGTIGGTVTDQAGRPAAVSRVVVFPEDQRRWGARSRFIRTAEAAPDGTYTIGGLLPGTYTVIAIDWLDDGTWEDPDVLGKLQMYGGPHVTVGAQRIELNLKRVGGAG